MEKQVTVISIVTFNSQKIFQTLDYLKAEIETDSSYQVTVFDNGSEREFVRKLKAYEPFVEVIEGHENKGFGFGHNLVLNQTQAQQAIIVNPDILVNKVALDAVVKRLKSGENIGAVAPRVLNSDGSTQHLIRKRVTVYDYFLRFLPFQFSFQEKRLKDYECRDLSETEPQFVPIASGCFIGINVPCFQAVGGFDERFFLYFEDTDLSREIGAAGYKILYDPTITITHLYERAAHKSFKMFFLFVRSMIQYFHKWGWAWF